MEKDKKYKLKRNAIIGGILTIAIGATTAFTQCHKDDEQSHEYDESTTSISNTLDTLDNDNIISIETSKTVAKPTPIPGLVTTPDIETTTPEEVTTITTEDTTTIPIEITEEQTTSEFTFPIGPFLPGTTNSWDIIKPGTSTRPSEILKPSETTNTTTKSSEVTTVNTTEPSIQTSTTIDTTKPPIESITTSSSQRPVTPPPYSSETISPVPSETKEPEPTPSGSKEPEPTPSGSKEPEPTPSETKEPEPTPSETKEPEPTPSETKEPEPTPSGSKEPEPTPSETQKPEPPHDHKWETTTTYKPNSDGTHTVIKTDTCGCGETKKTESKENCGYTPWKSAGVQGEERTCTKCGHVDKQEHKWETTTTYKPNSDGTHTVVKTDTCGCGETKKSETKENCGYTPWKSAGEQGEERTCTKCGHVDKQEHKWETTTTYKPNSDGTHTVIKTDTCGCGETKRTETTKSHNFSEWVSAEDQGEKRICHDCGHIEYRRHDFKDTTSYEYAGNGQHKEITSHVCKTCGYIAPNTEKLTSCNPGSPELAANGNDVQTKCGDCRHVEVIHSHNMVTIEVPSTEEDVCYVNVTKCGDSKCPLPPTEVKTEIPHDWEKDYDTYNPFEGTIDEVCDKCNKSRTVPYTDGIDNKNSLLVKDVLYKYREYLTENRKLNSVLYTEDLIDKKFYVEEPKRKYKSRY